MRARVCFEGRVQGVGFRVTAQAIARRFPITGWVRNEADGSVLLEAQGDEAQVQAFVAAIRRTMGAYVRAADLMPIDERPGESGFSVRR